MRVRPAPRSFAAGELAPWLDGIATEATARGCRTLENWIVVKAGGVARRAGTFHVQVSAGDSTAASRLIPFISSDGTSYVLEFYTNLIVVFKQSTHAQVATVTTTYANAHLAAIRYLQIGDELYLVHQNYEPRKLTWTDDTTWELSIIEFYEDQQFIVGHSVTAVYTSQDGNIWTEHKLNIAGDKDIMAVETGGGAIVAAGFDAPPAIRYSTDGMLTWQIGGAIANVSTVQDICYGNGKFLLVTAHTGTKNAAYSSDDGATWTEIAIQAAATSLIYAAVYSESLNLFVVGGSDTADSNNPIIYTASGADLDTWTARTSNMGAGDYVRDITWTGTKFIATGVDGKIVNSADGATWVSRTSNATTELRRVHYGNGIALALSNSECSLSTDNGDTWIAMTGFMSDYIMGIENNGERWVAVDVNGQVHISTDNGYTWTNGIDIGAGTFYRMTFFGLPKFNKSGDYPSCIAFHGDRVIMAGTVNNPGRLDGSKIGDYANFTQSWLANYAWQYALGGRTNVDIQWIESTGKIIGVGSRTQLGGMAGSPEVGITPSTVQFQWLKPHGSKAVQGLGVGDYIIFLQRGGEVIRRFPDDVDLTAIADHIAVGGVTEIHYQDDPFGVVWFVRADGQLLSLTVENGMAAWARHVIGGTDAAVESICIVPNSTTNEDEIWLSVARTIGGGTVRDIEYMDAHDFGLAADAHFVDAGVESANSVTMSTMGSLTHLAGELVDVLIDGNEWLTAISVAASGTIVFTSGYSGTQCHAGLPYASRLQTMRADYGSPWGSGAGFEQRASRLWMWTYESIGIKTGPAENDLSEEVIASGSAADLSTDV